MIFGLFFVIMFIFFDTTLNFFYSKSSFQTLNYFIGKNIFSFSGYNLFLNALLLYLILISFLFLSFFFPRKYIELFSNRSKKYLTLKINPIILFIISLIIFTIFFGIYLFFNILLKKEQSFLTFYLTIFFYNIGFIGILGIYLSYFSFKKNKQLFYVLLLWFIFLFGLASALTFLKWIQYPLLNPAKLPYDDLFLMDYWFTRNYFYSVIPLSIFSSIGIIDLGRCIKSKRYSKRISKYLKSIPNLISVSAIIFLSFSNIICYGIVWSSLEWNIRDEEAQIIGWVSENLPDGSNILLDNDKSNLFAKDLEAITSHDTAFYIDVEVSEALRNYNHGIFLNQIILHLKSKDIQYFVYSKENNSKKKFVEKYFDIEKELIPTFYKIKLYEYKNLVVYSTKEL